MSDFSHDRDFHQLDGFSLYYSSVAPMAWSERSSQQAIVLIPWGETPVGLTINSEEQAKVFEFTFPEIAIIPPQQLFSFRLSNPQPLMILGLELKSLLRANPEILVDSHQSLMGQYGICDSVLRFVATVLRDRYLNPSPNNALYCRTLVVLLLIHLITTYGAKGLSSKKSKKAKEADGRLALIFPYIEENLDQELKVATLAERTELSSPHFCRIFKKSTGLSPHRYILLKRIDKAKELLRSSAVALSEIALQCGFYDQSHFNLQFRNFTGMTPKAYRDNH